MDYYIVEAAKENALMENAITNGINNAKAKVRGAVDAGKARAKKFDRDTYINSLSIGDAKKAIKTGLTKKERVELAAIRAGRNATSSAGHITSGAGSQLTKLSGKFKDGSKIGKGIGKIGSGLSNAGGKISGASSSLGDTVNRYQRRGKIRKGVAAGVGIAGAAGATAGIAAHLLKKKKQKEDAFADGYTDALMEMYDYEYDYNDYDDYGLLEMYDYDDYYDCY